MADVHDKATRSYNMSRIKGKDTKPEIFIRKLLHAHGFRFRIHVKTLPGKPDLVLQQYKAVINIHGCFFHRHKNCKYCTNPSSSSATNWIKKFQGTIERDRKNNKALKALGWKVITIWACETKIGTLPNTIISLMNKLS